MERLLRLLRCEFGRMQALEAAAFDGEVGCRTLVARLNDPRSQGSCAPKRAPPGSRQPFADIVLDALDERRLN